MTEGGVTYYYHLNSHGDVVALTDASGNVVAQYEYDAWGNILSKTGALATANPYRYAGYYYDEETGLYYLMARYYDANMGRFLTRDTFHGSEGDNLSLNLYTYSQNNPIIYVDPSGHAAVSTWVSYTKYKGKLYYDGDAIIKHNVPIARQHMLNLVWFKNIVNYRKPWDYKNKANKYNYLLGKKVYTPEQFGNIHYGAVGTAAGFSPLTLLVGAGIAQIRSGNGGKWYAFGDDPKDQAMIRLGIGYYTKNFGIF
ncbi:MULTISPECIES: RHS repeat-associated core domain-containing protein [Anoxybacillaceae]|uniref:RHS repeat-associated core domain-containing protein n=1 Tax=Anoxybacillaceae TaxID=3120669 RepID=UPI001F48D2D7|nr:MULTISPECIES: RHS repeat-associated core domain-containing protein [Anoxybacillus]